MVRITRQEMSFFNRARQSPNDKWKSFDLL